MQKKKIFITGAGSGLGKEASITLARRGHKVYASVQYEAQIEELAQLSKQENLDIHVFKLDILLEKDRKLISNYDIDILICNAAIGDSGSICEIDIDRVKKVFETNIFCNFAFMQLAIKNMIKNKHHGRIIFLSSLVGRIPMPFLSPYCASKAAIETFVTCLRQELKLLPEANIEVCLIEPGAYATGFNKENNLKKYEWMEKKSYFLPILNKLKYYEKKIWNFLEKKPYNSIIRKYVKAVETKHLKLRYYAPWWQVLFVQLGRIIGM